VAVEWTSEEQHRPEEQRRGERGTEDTRETARLQRGQGIPPERRRQLALHRLTARLLLALARM